MNAHELTDPDHEALTITTQHDQTWITCTSGGNEVTVGPFPTHEIVSSLPARPAAHSRRPGPAAPSVELLESALKAALDAERTTRQERDEALRIAQKALDEADEHLRHRATCGDCAQPRPLTLDDISPDMMARFIEAYTNTSGSAGTAIRAGVRAMLTEPSTRRVVAQRLDPIIDAAIRGHSDITSPTVVHAISDALTEEGVQLVTEAAER